VCTAHRGTAFRKKNSKAKMELVKQDADAESDAEPLVHVADMY
jgi:hypothetical protein